METETTLRTRKHVTKSVQIQLEKMHVCFQLLQDHVKDIILDTHTIQKLNLVSILPMAAVMETIIGLSQMMSAKLSVLKMIQILPNTWSTNVAFQLNLGHVLETLRGKSNKTKYFNYLIFLHKISIDN